MWIKTAMSPAEKNESKVAVFEQTGFPGVIGFVDGTHIRIISPRQEQKHLYLNRKGFYSLNVMIVSNFSTYLHDMT